MKRRSATFWILQAALALAIAVFVWRAIAQNWDAFQSMELSFTLRPIWIVGAAVTILATYALLVEAWRRVLVGWDQRLSYPAAVRIWTVSNLGRYLPGKIWSLAGLAVLAQRRGVAGWAAGGSAVTMQVIAVGTGVAVTAATARGAVSTLWLALAGAVALAMIVILTMPGPFRLLGRLVGREDLRALRPAALVQAFLAAAASWVAYGVAFWCLARGLLGTNTLSITTAVSVFAAGYIAGLVAIIAPGGIGVREVVLIGLLTPSLGGGGAIALSVGSRLLLTITEVGAAAAGLLIPSDHRNHDRA